MSETITHGGREVQCKNDWLDKSFHAVCFTCERVIHAGESEPHARRKAREHEQTMAKYVNPEDADDPDHARLMNPDGVEHDTGVRYNNASA